MTFYVGQTLIDLSEGTIIQVTDLSEDREVITGYEELDAAQLISFTMATTFYRRLPIGSIVRAGDVECAVCHKPIPKGVARRTYKVPDQAPVVTHHDCVEDAVAVCDCTEQVCVTCGAPATYRIGMPQPTWCDLHGPHGRRGMADV